MMWPFLKGALSCCLYFFSSYLWWLSNLIIIVEKLYNRFSQTKNLDQYSQKCLVMFTRLHLGTGIHMTKARISFFSFPLKELDLKLLYIKVDVYIQILWDRFFKSVFILRKGQIRKMKSLKRLLRTVA